MDDYFPTEPLGVERFLVTLPSVVKENKAHN